MRIKLFSLACLVLVVSAHAQTAPKVVFTGDSFTFAWQNTPQFTANPNWIGAGVNVCCLSGGSNTVAADFQTNVINQHPAFVLITTGESDVTSIHDSTPLGVEWHVYEEAIMQMVDMAQQANIKVILGNTPAQGYDGQFFNVWLGQYGLANHIPVVNYHDALCQCAGLADAYGSMYATPEQNSPVPTLDPTDAGYTLITEMAQTAIATYGLTIKSGYLSNVLTTSAFIGAPPSSQVNVVVEGEQVTFTPQAKWSDGVVRPMLNEDYNGLKGTWTSSNPFVMTVNQQGQAYAYGAGTATISFKSASGVVFSPWKMTVEEVYPPNI
jgi:hypothetical protein